MLLAEALKALSSLANRAISDAISKSFKSFEFFSREGNKWWSGLKAWWERLLIAVGRSYQSVTLISKLWIAMTVKRVKCYVFLLYVSHLSKVEDNKRLLIVVGRSYQCVLILNCQRLLDRYLIKTAFLDSWLWLNIAEVCCYFKWFSIFVSGESCNI